MSTNAYTHELKTDHEPFSAVLIGEKKHEIRLDDRDFKVGDTLILRETRYTRAEMVEDGRPLEYTGRTVERVVTHIQRGYGLPSGHVVMSLGEPSRRDALYRKALAMGDDPGVIGGAARIPAISDEWFAGRNVWGSTRAQWLEFVRQYAYAPTQLIDALAAPAPAPVIADTASLSDAQIDWIVQSGRAFSYDEIRAKIGKVREASIADTAGAIDKKAIAWDAHQTCARIPGATHYNAAEIAIDAVLKAIAATPASSSDTAGAKPVAQWQTKLREPILPESDTWINVSEEGARKTIEKWSHVYEVRALVVATPASSVADAAGASERARFEAWLTETDDYIVDAQWEAWQAAIAKESGK